jgi:hypothetical protein
LTNAKKGYLENGFVFAGANAYRVKKIISVKELTETIQKEYDEASSDSLLLRSSIGVSHKSGEMG